MKLESSATFYKSKEGENTHVLDTTAKLPKWRPRRDHDGKHARQEFSSLSIKDGVDELEQRPTLGP